MQLRSQSSCYFRHVTTKFPKISMQYVKLSSKLPTKALEQQSEVKSKTNDFTKKLQCELQTVIMPEYSTLNNSRILILVPVLKSGILCCLVWWLCQDIFSKYFSNIALISHFSMVMNRLKQKYSI